LILEASEVVYLSMEIALEPLMPTYSGGLGVLAGDTLRSAADLEIPLVGVTLVHRKGYFQQTLDAQGHQREEPVRWRIEDFAERLEARAEIEIEGRPLRVAAWRHWIEGATGFRVPVYLLDADLPENDESARRLTDVLYGGDGRHRLCQEAILGLGGLRMLRALGHERVLRFHMNEGHAALVVLGLLEEEATNRGGAASPRGLEQVREHCVFTTHTPVPAGHDRFPPELVASVLGDARCQLLQECLGDGEINMTELALRGSAFVNGVAMRHGEISRGMFPSYPIHSITNGVHVRTWAAPPFQALYDRFLPAWRRDALSLRYAISIPYDEIWRAHESAKRALLETLGAATGARFDPDALTLGFARRATAYKRATLLFHDLERLRALTRSAGPLQIVFAGKAHPRDEEGKGIIEQVHRAREALAGEIAVAWLPNYDMALGKLLCAGCDVWLNTPIPPLEASGTSGMKAAVNGVPSLSILDGWWVEGHIEGLTGWAFGAREPTAQGVRSDEMDASSLYDVLASSVMPTFYRKRDHFVEVMRQSIAMNASFFNTERMLWQYLHGAYRPRRGSPREARVTPG
jgi:starch phosphorylase